MIRGIGASKRCQLTNKIFVSGSISGRFGLLKDSIHKSIKNAMDKEMEFLVGDAPGVDKEIQNYLNKKEYQNVSIYYVGDSPRNFANQNWDRHQIFIDTDNPKHFKNGKFTRAAQMLKDEEMCNHANFGMTIWQDTKLNRFNNIEVSKGTLNNMVRMLNRETPVKLFYLPKPELGEIWLRSLQDLNNFIFEHCKDETKNYFTKNFTVKQEIYTQESLLDF